MDKKQIIDKIESLKKQLIDADKKEVERKQKRLLDRIKKSGLLDRSDEELDAIFSTLSSPAQIVQPVQPVQPVQTIQPFNV